MDVLSPRDSNARLGAKPSIDNKTKSTKPMSKEKDHPHPPPTDVLEPRSSDRRHGAVYKTGKCLGKGGFAICYEGRLAGTKEIFALKIVKSHMPQKKMEQKFQTELQIHSKMRHHNIVSFHRAFSFGSCTYIVLELCANGSLMDMVRKRRYITEPEVRFYTVQIAGAIKYMHAKGIIHRDLKMGNIFLDKDMNVKVGDFGLAALLMSGKDMQACRRTTLCGTPNYIAPEILEKAKGGHDHTVDIWSLGIIIFALLTGKPPFQSSSADEIYRRAKGRQYDWPKLDTSENFISQETKDLVAILLQGPDERPPPDVIVQHSFFTCGWMPQESEMTNDLLDAAPSPNKFLSVGVRGGRSDLYTRNLKKLCIKCEVGPWNTAPKPYISTYKECAAEEKAGLTPVVPLAEGLVYRPFDEWLEEESERVLDEAENSTTVSYMTTKPAEKITVAKRKEQPGFSSNKTNAQSFAAQQRGRPLLSASGNPLRAATSNKPDREFSSNAQAARSNEPSPGPLLTVPSRHTKAIRKPEPANNVLEVEGRIAADLVEQLNRADAERKSQEKRLPLPGEARASLFNPRERVESLGGTRFDTVLDSLRRLQAELERALNTRSMALVQPTRRECTVVVKWVDYSNKFGLGYILSNGSIGCVFKEIPVNAEDPSLGITPPTCIVVRGGEKHCENRNKADYEYRDQLVPTNGPNIEFYENRGDYGIVRGKVNPLNYKVKGGPSGEPGRLLRGVDEWDDRKRERVVLWKKFANYMVAFGRDGDYPYDDTTRIIDDDSGLSEPPGNVVTFYQRFGDVGVWFFADGHYQFNFPDHTKIILSEGGIWCEFYHLPLEAARDLSLKGTIPPAALDDRQNLSYPLQTILNFMTKPNTRVNKSPTRKRPKIDPMIQGIPGANDFRRKIEFIKNIVKEWVTNGGIGISDMTPKGRMRWLGYRECINVKAPYKHVWVQIGGKGSVARHVAWFDPKKPGQINADIEC